jgi:hypothetical protein
MLAIPWGHDLLHVAKPIAPGRNTATFKASAGQPTVGAYGACPSQCPSTVMRTTNSVFDIMPLKCSGAKGTRTPGLLHAIHGESVRHSPG